jgi:dolichol-phosphate mannosyltransferase
MGGSSSMTTARRHGRGRSLAAQAPGRVVVVHRPAKLGLGTAYIAGFKTALNDLGAERVLPMDADFSHNPRYIPGMIALSRERHVVIGSRYVPGGGTRHCSWQRIALSRGHLARTLLGCARDATAGFRLYRREVLLSIPLTRSSPAATLPWSRCSFLPAAGWQIGEADHL